MDLYFHIQIQVVVLKVRDRGIYLVVMVCMFVNVTEYLMDVIMSSLVNQHSCSPTPSDTLNRSSDKRPL